MKGAIKELTNDAWKLGRFLEYDELTSSSGNCRGARYQLANKRFKGLLKTDTHDRFCR